MTCHESGRNYWIYFSKFDKNVLKRCHESEHNSTKYVYILPGPVAAVAVAPAAAAAAAAAAAPFFFSSSSSMRRPNSLLKRSVRASRCCSTRVGAALKPTRGGPEMELFTTIIGPTR